MSIVQPSDIIIDKEMEEDSLSNKSKQLDLELSSPDPLELLLITDAKIDLKKVLIRTNKDYYNMLTI